MLKTATDKHFIRFENIQFLKFAAKIRRQVIKTELAVRNLVKKLPVIFSLKTLLYFFDY